MFFPPAFSVSDEGLPNYSLAGRWTMTAFAFARVSRSGIRFSVSYAKERLNEYSAYIAPSKYQRAASICSLLSCASGEAEPPAKIASSWSSAVISRSSSIDTAPLLAQFSCNLRNMSRSCQVVGLQIDFLHHIFGPSAVAEKPGRGPVDIAQMRQRGSLELAGPAFARKPHRTGLLLARFSSNRPGYFYSSWNAARNI